MKRDKLISALWAFLLSFGLSLAAVMCPVSAFRLDIDTARLMGVCFWAALLCSLCNWLPLSPVPLAAGAAILGYLWRDGTLEAGVEAILNRLSRQYNKAYGWGIIRWGYRTADDMEPSILIPLCIWGALVALLTAWAVCRKKPQFPALLAALVPLSTCFVVTDTLPETGWLYVFFLIFVVLLLTGSSRRQEEKQGNRLTLFALPVTALALLVLFAALPKETYNGQENAKKMVETIFHSDPVQLLMGHLDENSAVGGDSGNGSVDLRSVGYRVESEAQVLEVTAPFTGQLYLRGRALDKYDGTSWSDSGRDYSSLPWPDEELESVGEVSVSTRFAHRMLYMPYYSDTMQLLELSTGMENDKKLTQYSFNCRRLLGQGMLTRYYPTADTPADPVQNQLMADFMKDFPIEESVSSWANSTVWQIIGGYVSPYHKAEAIASYVRNSASYDTQTSRMPLDGTDFARWFLEESETGYCVHFATAAVVLLQEAGIPARYVTGYLVPVKAGEVTPVRSNQSHAWAEYWLPGYGWTVLEATPADMRPTETPPTETTEPTVTQPPETLPDTTTPSAEAPRQEEAVTEVSLLPWLLAVAAVAAVLCAAEVQRAVRLGLRRKKRQAATPNRLALLYWVTAERLAKHLKEQPDEQLLEIAQMAKYSRHTVTQAQLDRFVKAEKAAVSRLKKRNFLLRLYYRWILVLY